MIMAVPTVMCIEFVGRTCIDKLGRNNKILNYNHYILVFHINTVAALTDNMKRKPFSLLVDGSSDTSIEKLNPLTVRIYDDTKRQVTTQLVDMCTTSGRSCGTASAIFSKIDSVISTLGIPWINCVGFGVDNTSVNVGCHHSIKTHNNSACYFMGCPCHLVHNIACHASEALQNVAGFDVEDVCVDVFY